MVACAVLTLMMGLLAKPAMAFNNSKGWMTPVLRIAMGPAVHFSPEPKAKVYYAVEPTVGLTWAKDDEGLIWNVELGYAYDAVGTHAFVLAPGVGYGTSALGVRYQPRILAGRGGGSALLGMRNSLVGYVGYDMFTLEVGHQFAHWGSQDVLRHDVRAQLGVNPAAIVGVLLAGAKSLCK